MAAEDGLLDLDERVSDTLHEWKEDPRKSKITIRQLLSLSSGIDGGKAGEIPSGREAVEQAEARAKPGERFSYGPIPFQCWGELLRRKLEGQGESVESYMKRRLLDPIGLTPAFWRKDEDGGIRMPSGAYVTAKEWAKFGKLILAWGEWNGKSLVSKKRLQECFNGSKANPNYGLTFWLNCFEGVPSDLVMAAGLGKQKLYVVPSEKLLIVQFAQAGSYEEEEFLHRFFAKDGKTRSSKNSPGDARPGVEDQAVGLMARLRLMDKNGDRQLSADEAGDWVGFESADADSDGRVTLREIVAFRRQARRR